MGMWIPIDQSEAKSTREPSCRFELRVPSGGAADVHVFCTSGPPPIAHDADDMLSIAGVIIWVGVVASELLPELLAEPLFALFATFGPSDALRAFLPPAEVPLVAGEEGLDLEALVLTLFLRDGPFSLLGGLARFLRTKCQRLVQDINGDRSRREWHE